MDYRRFLPIPNTREAYRAARRAIILRYCTRHGRDMCRIMEAELYGFQLGWFNYTHYGED